MYLRVLSENECFRGGLGTEFGLSLYMEANGKKLLFDTGASGLFAQNAQALGIDLSAVDALVLSHGHYDHGGGLKTFLECNSHAPVYLRQNAFGLYCSSRTDPPSYLGLDRSLASSGRLRFTGLYHVLAPGLTLFSGVEGRRLFSPSNSNLCEQTAAGVVPDSFTHEQNLVIQENGHTILVAGCCHNGILNTLDRASQLGFQPQTVISGMHFLRLDLEQHGALVDDISAELSRRVKTCYTCHCTGMAGYERMKQTLGDRIGYIDCGAELTL